MKTVGQILQNRRIEKKLSIEDVEKLTKIRRKFVQAIESDSFTSIPSQTYTKGFIKNYAQFY
jgi:cytoskeletal protein RodZ